MVTSRLTQNLGNDIQDHSTNDPTDLKALTRKLCK